MTSDQQASGEDGREEDDQGEAKKFKLDVEKLVEDAWLHYTNYLESTCGISGSAGDVDELMELLELLDNGISIPPFATATDKSQPLELKIKSRQDCLPILISVVSAILADEAISRSLVFQQNEQQQKHNIGVGPESEAPEQEKTTVQVDIRRHLTRAITMFPQNALAWSMAANYGRMNSFTDPITILSWYQHAAHCASQVRQAAIQLLEEETNVNDKSSSQRHPEISDDVKEWIESLLLHQVTGVELCEAEDEEEDNEAACYKKEQNSDVETWSASTVESTARFMAAMISSTLGKHDAALEQLQYFDLTHRLHPNVWDAVFDEGKEMSNSNDHQYIRNHSHHHGKGDNGTICQALHFPVMYYCETGILPPYLYQRLCSVFAPNASYWRESDYATRGYFSFFMDRRRSKEKDDNKPPPPLNLIEHVIVHYMMPHLQEQLHKHAESIAGFEWWVHTRPTGANLGHNLHFDTDEALLAQRRKQKGDQDGDNANDDGGGDDDDWITHPLVSSVLYLTTGESEDQQLEARSRSRAGATIILNQTPQAAQPADCVWYNVPKSNTFMTFPGNLLHGVLPCPAITEGTSNISEATTKSTDAASVSTSSQGIHKLWADKGQAASETDLTHPSSNHRLTFMVGFWDRRVPDRMREQKIYGPCGPLPEVSDDNSWVREIHKGYESNKAGAEDNGSESKSACTAALASTTTAPVKRITPAWECITSKRRFTKQDPVLEIPRSIDHRFFVRGAPECFRASLLERDDGDDVSNSEEHSESS